MRLRNSFIMGAVLRGGVADSNSIPPALMKEMYLMGNRPGHYRAFLSLLRNASSWETGTKSYGRIDVESCSFGETRIGQGRLSANMMAS